MCPDEYQFKVTQHWRENRLTVDSRGRDGSGWLVTNKETAIESINKALLQAAPSVVATDGPLPTRDNVTVSVANNLDFEIDSADVIPDHDEIDLDFLI